jgi:hypothetical protein
MLYRDHQENSERAAEVTQIICFLDKIENDFFHI